MNLTHVMDVVLKCANEIHSKGLKHQKIQAFLEEIGAEFRDVHYCTYFDSMAEQKPTPGTYSFTEEVYRDVWSMIR